MIFRYLYIITLSLVLLSTAQANIMNLDHSGPVVVGDRVVFESNDAGESVSMSLQEYEEMTGKSFLLSLVSFFDFKKSFETISTYLTPTLEEAYDVFVLVNVSYEKYGDPNAYIPSQHMRVLKKSSPGQKVFLRDSDGVIVDVYSDVAGSGNSGALSQLSGLMPVSSGAGGKPADPQAYVDTPTGIYRINAQKSRDKRFQTGMWHSMYFDLVYPWGKASGLAIHGTSKSAYKRLGTQQSHGCVRVTQAQANSMYETFLSSDYQKNLPDMSRTARLKAEKRDANGNVVYRKGPNALFIIFYGYDGQPGIQI